MLPKLHTGMYQIKNIVGAFFFNRTKLWCDVNFNRRTQKNENVNRKKKSMHKRKDFIATDCTVNSKRWNICIKGNVLHNTDLFNRLHLATSFSVSSLASWLRHKVTYLPEIWISHCFIDSKWELKVSWFKLPNADLKIMLLFDCRRLN